MANPNFGSVLSTTLYNYAPKIADNISKSNVLLSELKKKGNMKMLDGAERMLLPIEYPGNNQYQRYAGYDTITVSPTDEITSAEYNWKQVVVPCMISGLEQLQNSGKARVFDLLKAKIRVAEKTLQNGFAVDVYSDGTATAGKQIGGLDYIISDTPDVGVVGGIDGATYTWWRNKVFSGTTDGGGAVTVDNILPYMEDLKLQLTRGKDRPRLIVADKNYYKLYWEALQKQQRFVGKEMKTTGGFNALAFDEDIPVVYDDQCPADTMYFLNTDYLYLGTHPQRNFVPLGVDGSLLAAKGQDAEAKWIAWAGNLLCSNRSLQGKLIA